jgi:hypothetical protein
LFGGSKNRILELLEWGLSTGRRSGKVTEAEGGAEYNTEDSPKGKPEFKAKGGRPSLPILWMKGNWSVILGLSLGEVREVEGEVVAASFECWS